MVLLLEAVGLLNCSSLITPTTFQLLGSSGMFSRYHAAEYSAGYPSDLLYNLARWPASAIANANRFTSKILNLPIFLFL